MTESWILPVAFAVAGVLNGWIGEGRWHGLEASLLTLVSGMWIGAAIAKKEKDEER